MTSPGAPPRRPRWAVTLAAVVLAAAVVYVLFTVVFPWADRTLLNDPTLGVVSGSVT